MQAKVKNRFFVKLDMRYTYYFTKCAQYFGRSLRLLKYMYGMNNSGKLFADELTEWLLEAGNVPDLVMPYMDFNNIKDLSKYFAYSGK